MDLNEGGVAIVGLPGEHEAFSAPRIEERLEALQLADRAIVIDLTQTAFIDSTVVSALIRAAEAARRRKLKLGVVIDESTGWAVKHLFEIAKLRAVLPVGATPTEALEAAEVP